MNDIKRLAGYIGSYKKDMMLGALMVMIETAFELVIPIMIADLIDVGVANHDLAYIYSKGFQMGICALLALVTVCSEGFLWMGSEDQGGRICKSDAVFFLKSGSF